MRTPTTAIFIGGTVTFASGTQVDSRQGVEADPFDFCLRRSLGRSEQWWSFASSLAEVLLKEQGEGAWALVWGPKTVFRSRGDATFKRVRFRTLVRDSEFLMDGPAVDKDRLVADRLSARYRVLEYPLRFEHVDTASPPTVFIGGYLNAYGRRRSSPLDLVPLDVVVSRWPDTTLILPDIPVVRETVESVLEWSSSGRPGQPNPMPGEADEFEEERQKHSEHLDGLLAADFQITKFLDRGVAGDASGAQAALSMVSSRYDLKLGFWDLTRDEVLRDNLLSKEPVPLAPSKPAPVPKELKKRAKQAATKRESEGERRERLHGALFPTLQKGGWVAAHWKKAGTSYLLPMGREIPSLFEYIGTTYSLYWSLVVHKNQTVLHLSSPARSVVAATLNDHEEALASVCGKPPECDKGVVARFAKMGWAAEEVDVEEMAAVIQRAIGVLDPLRSDLVKQVDDYLEESNYPTTGGPLTVTIGVDLLDSPDSGEEQRPRGFFARLLGRK